MIISKFSYQDEHEVTYLAKDFAVEQLGECNFDSPLMPLLDYRQHTVNYVEESDRILIENTVSAISQISDSNDELFGLEPAGARRKIFFNPATTKAAIVTCGGLCPGLNNVIRSLTNELNRRYKIEKIYGIINGYEGFNADLRRDPIELTPKLVENIHEHGGTILGSSRGQQCPKVIVDYLEELEVDILFVIGGDGTLRGGMGIANEIATRGKKISVIGVPKTIDNDIMFTDQSFGFQTALSEGTSAIRAAHVEACGCPQGVGLVKLMGRHSGFIACYSSLAVSDANFVLIPEVPFELEGEHGLFASIKRRLKSLATLSSLLPKVPVSI